MKYELFKYLVSLPLGILIFSFFFSFTSVWFNYELEGGFLKAWYINTLFFLFYGFSYMVSVWFIYVFMCRYFLFRIRIQSQISIFFLIAFLFFYIVTMPDFKRDFYPYFRMALSCGISGVCFGLLLNSFFGKNQSR
jgi:hypothetical protein